MGWYYMLKKQTRDLAKFGAWGIHASLLPNYAGGAPLVWAIINGEKETGVTLFRMDDGVDDGDIIAQSKFAITDFDDIRTVYQKALEASNEILQEIMLKNEPPSFLPQDKSSIKIFSQRNPQEGEIDWSWGPIKIKNFIRAQTKPYPGAWTVISGKKVIIWSADIEEL
jgi:methionyl-tRNA formyltransferase